MSNVTDDQYIALIINGEFNAIPDFKIGELFESFFDDINYNVVKEEDKVFVDFTGEAECDNEPCTILIRFSVFMDTEEFEIDEVKVNEDILDEDEIVDLLEDIAYIGGANMEHEDDYYECTEEACSHCHHNCANNPNKAEEDEKESEDEKDSDSDDKKDNEENDDNK